MNIIRLFVLAAVAAGATGCAFHTGMKLEDFPTAQGPEGATVRVTLNGTAYLGELLEVRPDALVIVTSVRFEKKSHESIGRKESVVRRIPNEGVTSIGLEPRAGAAIKMSLADPDSRERLRLISRFPQGLSPELLQRILKMYGQSDVAGGTP
jgi:hypothetical protein